MRELKGIKIGKHYIEKPIIQGGMGVGISWDQLAGNVSKNGGLGTISAICTGYYQNMKFVKKEVDGRPLGTENAYSRKALFEIFKNARQICGDKPLACNILHAINDYERVVNDALEAGANIIVTGAGLPLELPRLTENYPDVEIVPIVSSARALKIICKKWKAAGRTPGAVIVEGPKSGGHQGAKYNELFAPEHQLEAILPPIKEERDKWGDFPIIAAGGIWDREDIEKIMDLGADAVQLGTRFIGTHECDASPVFKQVLLDSKEEDIVIVSSPVGYPGRAVKTNLIKTLEPDTKKIKCISNCIFPCNRGEGARRVGYCIADSLGDAYLGRLQSGLFFSGANGYKLKEIVHVKDLIDELMTNEK
ncbi:oxidoreductase, 2-nitropropane dioxygenase family protein [Leptotrichia sp. oral taxon 215 str. W9775]|uniref:nitronate monooxygenase n=1 Tax=Leptotrichia sp. oral taxon 215 TaxID=712359 RepID=UPI0003ADF5F1|nr:nitronate monooxygenase family protein [Leptotrichia sp. oral taxon 215]ERK66695.1 oxidoreductase, 2-nitropropane dioxygenase family protein [Leptotrichia sp. oral taxon 215 str. W9775]